MALVPILETSVRTRDELELPLVRYAGGVQKGRSVLLIHGASAARDTFLVPQGASLVEYLLEAGYDVWALDWRGGKRAASEGAKCSELYTLDRAAAFDLPAALDLMRNQLDGEHRNTQRISIIAHCLGSGMLACAIAAGHVQSELGVDSIVLSTLGLFYVAPWDGWLKAQDYILETVLLEEPECRTIHPNRSFPRAMQAAFERWPRVLQPSCGNTICKRLSFMFGRPYLSQNLADGLHAEAALLHQFGDMPIALYVHCGQNLRRGTAALFDGGSGFGARAEQRGDAQNSNPYLSREHFRRFRITLITGAQNALWHRDSIDRMYDWLRRTCSSEQCRKHIFSGYGHQDLLWGKTAHRDVFPKIKAGLAAPSNS